MDTNLKVGDLKVGDFVDVDPKGAEAWGFQGHLWGTILRFDDEPGVGPNALVSGTDGDDQIHYTPGRFVGVEFLSRGVLLSGRCGAFNVGENGVPEGWVEIQRFDSVDVEGAEPFESDEHAACAVARATRSGALLFDVETGATLMLDTTAGAEGTTSVRADVRTATERQIKDGDAENDGTPVRWICIVTRIAAEKAGVL